MANNSNMSDNDVYSPHNEITVTNKLESFSTTNGSFCDDSFSFLDSQIDFIKFTGRTSDGDVDVSDALSINVINEINTMKMVIESSYSYCVSSFIQSAISSARIKDEQEKEKILAEDFAAAQDSLLNRSIK